MARIEEWDVVTVQDSPYRAPEESAQFLAGKIFDDERFEDGDPIVTTSIQGQRDGKVVTKSGSLYELGTPNPLYEKLYPNARERLFATLPQV